MIPDHKPITWSLHTTKELKESDLGLFGTPDVHFNMEPAFDSEAWAFGFLPCDTRAKSAIILISSLHSSVLTCQISGRNFFQVEDDVTTRIIKVGTIQNSTNR
ncbi:hypothetical protein HanOQP8_Chr08g0270091 [Helianthus annuus]|nr:hypothetical protein HanHA89_Chr08g0280691 [Helianthus annuus]KAJ0720983.1 hypothetical protein HanOQP8_Chr08g0270091 [Helianthus annuus]